MKINFVEESSVEGLEDHMIKLNRVTKVVRGGRNFSFSALVVVGNRNGVVGLGFGKAREIPEAIRKGVQDAKKKLYRINLQKHTIPYMVEGKYCASRVKLIPAAEGTGVIAGVNIRSVLEYAGVENILSKSYGSRNIVNATKAALKALVSLESSTRMSQERDLKINDFLN